MSQVSLVHNINNMWWMWEKCNKRKSKHSTSNDIFIGIYMKKEKEKKFICGWIDAQEGNNVIYQVLKVFFRFRFKDRQIISLCNSHRFCYLKGIYVYRVPNMRTTCNENMKSCNKTHFCSQSSETFDGEWHDDKMMTH